MKRILIVEDEAIASQHLRRLLGEVLGEEPETKTVETVDEAVEELRKGGWTLAMMDIHLADGLSFKVFERVEPECPVIFTTAYDEYALEAFRAGGYDYLLKPIDRASLAQAIEKVGRAEGGKWKADSEKQKAEAGEGLPKQYRSHFLIRVRDRLIPVEVKQVAYFYLEDKIARAVMYDGREQIVDGPLESVMEELDPRRFFRANRQYIVAHEAVKEIGFWPVSKLVLTLKVETPSRVVVSKARVGEFKRWYMQ